jgi:hypothetical protein
MHFPLFSYSGFSNNSVGDVLSPSQSHRAFFAHTESVTDCNHLASGVYLSPVDTPFISANVSLIEAS